MRYIVPLIVTFLLASPAMAQRNNAATWYQRSFEGLDSLANEDWQAISDYREDPGVGPTREVRAILDRVDRSLSNARRGARLQYCDFHLDYSAGFGLELPHLSKMRRVASLMVAEALVAMHDGDPARAARDLGAVYRMASHIGEDAIVISSLVARSLYDVADQAVQYGVDLARFSTHDSRVLYDALNYVGADNPFRCTDAIAMEQSIAVDWMARQYGDEEGRTQLADEMPWLSDDSLESLTSMTDEEFAASLDEYDAMMDDVVEIFHEEDHDVAMEQFKDIEQRLLNGEFGAIAEVLTPAFGRVLEMRKSGEDSIASRNEMLERLIGGEALPEDEANAAIFYGRAMQAIADLKEEERAAVLGSVESISEEAAPVVARIFRETPGIIENLGEGAAKRECDFKLVRGKADEPCPMEVPGMREAVHFLLVDARRLAAEGDLDSAAERCAIVLRIVRHIEQDAALLMPLVAQEAVEMTMSSVGDFLADDPESVGPILAAADRLNRRDPFGYVGAIKGAHNLLRQRWSISSENYEDDIKRITHAEKITEQLADDERLYLEIVYGALGRSADEEEGATARWERLGALVDLDARRAIQDESVMVAPRIARFDYELFDEAPPSVCGYEDRRRSARAALREAVNALRELRGEVAEQPGHAARDQ